MQRELGWNGGRGGAGWLGEEMGIMNLRLMGIKELAGEGWRGRGRGGKEEAWSWRLVVVVIK